MIFVKNFCNMRECYWSFRIFNYYFQYTKWEYWSGTKGYWYNKKKDIQTINKLSESKEKQIVEYDVKGCLKKIWKRSRY